MRSPLQRLAWRLNSVPLWIKIMGIVVLPLSLVLLIATLGIRGQLNAFLEQQGNPQELTSLLEILSRDLLITVLLTAATGLLLAVGLSVLLARPLRQLLQTTRQVRQGDLSSRVEVHAGDEIGVVQQAFNEMLAELQGSQLTQQRLNNELNLLNRLLTAVAFGESVPTVIDTALQQALEILDSDFSSFYSYHPEEQQFFLQASRGFTPSDAPLPSPQVGLAGTPMRRAVETGQAVTLEAVQDAEELSDEIAELAKRAGFRGYACAPVRQRGVICGILNVGKRGERVYTPAELTLLESICSIIGLGLENAQLLDDLRQQEGEMRRALQRAVDLQEEERRRLSRELHDEIGQALTSILIRLKTLQQETSDPEVVDRLDGLRYLTGQSIEELRRLAMDLRPAALDGLGLAPALRWYTEQTAANTGRQIRFYGPEQPMRLPEEVEITLYRTAQEAITNALRHGEAQNIQVRLHNQPRAVWLEVSDDGAGFDPQDAARGLGLVGLRERLNLLDGQYEVQSEPGSGTRLWVEIPLPTDSGSPAVQA